MTGYRVLCDENVDPQTVRYLERDGHDAERHPDIRVLLFTNNRVGAYELASMVERLTSYYPEQDDLPREFYLSE